MLGSSIALTIDGVEKTLKLINQDGYSSEYLLKDTLSEFRLKIRHSKTKASGGVAAQDRHNVELRETIYAVGETPGYERLAYLVIQNNLSDLSIDNVTALNSWLSASSGAVLTALMGWES